MNQADQVYRYALIKAKAASSTFLMMIQQSMEESYRARQVRFPRRLYSGAFCLLAPCWELLAPSLQRIGAVL
jgi:hypothetical protein